MYIKFSLSSRGGVPGRLDKSSLSAYESTNIRRAKKGLWDTRVPQIVNAHLNYAAFRSGLVVVSLPLKPLMQININVDLF